MMSCLLPLFTLVFGWSYVCGAPVLHKWPWPQTVGMWSNTALTLLGVYAFGRVCRAMKVDEHLTNRHLVIIASVCVPLVMVGFGNYHSIFSALLAMAAFVWTSRINLSEWLGRIIIYIAPSMFSVYLLHSTRYGFGVIEVIEEDLPFGLILNAVIVGLFVFVVCVLVDLLRRCLCIKKAGLFLKGLDNAYDRAIGRLEMNLPCASHDDKC